MKRLLYLLLPACLGLTACEFEMSDNGDLDGYWQFTHVDSLQTGGTADMRYSQLFWSVQLNLLEIRNNLDVFRSVLFRFDKSGDRLRLWNPIANIKNISDSIITDTAAFTPYYIRCTLNADNTLETNLLVRKLNSDEMILQNDDYQLYFRKY